MEGKGGMAPAAAWRCSVAATMERTCGSVVQTRRHWRGRQLAAGPEGGRLYIRGGAGKTLRQTLNTLRAFQLPADDRSWGSVEGLVRKFVHRPSLSPRSLRCSPLQPYCVPVGMLTSIYHYLENFGTRVVKNKNSCARNWRRGAGSGRCLHPITPASPNTIALDSVLSWAVNITTLGI